ncbi:MAG: hypothetical protein ACP5M0_09965 [Desulfomonilaceae bacterium]
MRRFSIILSALLAAVFLICLADAADEPIKWSAPMQQYPNPWSPTAPPAPYYYYPNGYNYSGGAFGYGTYGGSWGYSGQYQGPYGYPQRGFSGNPYHSYYNQ